MKLSKRIPARTKTIKFLWCNREVMLYGKYRKSRERMKLRIDKSCEWCNYKFNDDDMLALACPETGTNMILCQKCAEELMASEKSPTTEDGA